MLHLAADRRSRPVSRTITAGQRHDRIGYPAVIAGIRIPDAGADPGPDPPGSSATKACSIRADLRRCGIAATIPERTDQQANRRKRPPTRDLATDPRDTA